MSRAALNGSPLSRAVVYLPRRGAWVADARHLEAPSLTAGDPATLELGEKQRFRGTAHRVTPFEGPARYDARIVGGAGGLSTPLTPAHYTQPSVRAVLEDALAETGEALSATSDLVALATPLRAWARRVRTLGEELDSLCSVVERVWRVLPDGTIWVGEDTWAEAAVGDYVVVDEEASAGKVVIAADEPTVLPGQTFLGRRVSQVVHQVEPEGVRTAVYLESAAGTERTMGALDALVRRSQSMAYHAVYEAEVVAQSSDGTLELQSTDERFPGLSQVPYRPGVPGASCVIPPGARCLVGFTSGSEQAPYVLAWTSGTPAEVSLPVTSLLHLGESAGSDFVALASLVEANLGALREAIFAAPVVAGDGGAAFKAALVAALATWPSSTAAAKVKAT